MYEGIPVLLVTHDAEDESWQFVNGYGDTDEGMKAVLVEPDDIVGLDPSLTALADLPLGWWAWRDGPEADWVRQPQPSRPPTAITPSMS
jgi:hypothetical protein